MKHVSISREASAGLLRVGACIALGDRIDCEEESAPKPNGCMHCQHRLAANVALYLALGYRIDREEESELGVTVYMSKTLSP